MHFYTSININYLAKARVLAESVKIHNPNSKFTVVLLDETPEGFNIEEEDFDNIFFIEDLDIPVENLDLWIYTHSVVELCTAVKGQALVKLLEEGNDKCVYLDPDIAVFDPLDELDELLDKYSVILTPHQTDPNIENEHIIDNEICSLRHGVYNFGFYAVKNSSEGLRFAKWWRDMLLSFCYDDIPNGLFTDQKWGDIVPSLFDEVLVLRNPGYNVATWNISNRIISKQDNKYFVNDVPLRFYHFSGFDSGAQELMLKKYGKDNKNLWELRNWYTSKQNSKGQEIYSKMKSKFNYYSNEEKIPKIHRETIKNRQDVYEHFKNNNPYIVKDGSYYFWTKTEIIYDDNINYKEEYNRILNSRSWRTITKLKKIIGKS